MQNIPVDMLIDTGSTFTLISSNLWKKCVAGSSCISLRKFEEPLVSASNETIQTLGCSTLILQLGSCIVKHSVVVANDLSHECIVGLDFLWIRKCYNQFMYHESGDTWK